MIQTTSHYIDLVTVKHHTPQPCTPGEEYTEREVVIEIVIIEKKTTNGNARKFSLTRKELEAINDELLAIEEKRTTHTATDDYFVD